MVPLDVKCPSDDARDPKTQNTISKVTLEVSMPKVLRTL